MKVSQIYDFLNERFPFASQEKWDNSGLIFGDPDIEVTRIVTALDPTADVARQAAEAGAQLAVTHHPLIFHAMKTVTPRDPVYAFIKYGVAAIGVHTNYDSAPDGVNFALAEKIGLRDHIPHPSSAFARVGYVDTVTPREFAEHLSRVLGGAVRFNAGGGPIGTVAVGGGSCADELMPLFGEIDAAVTGDASHHDFLHADEYGVTLFACGHFETENPSMEHLNELLSSLEGVEVIPAVQKASCITVAHVS